MIGWIGLNQYIITFQSVTNWDRFEWERLQREREYINLALVGAQYLIMGMALLLMLNILAIVKPEILEVPGLENLINDIKHTFKWSPKVGGRKTNMTVLAGHPASTIGATRKKVNLKPKR